MAKALRFVMIGLAVLCFFPLCKASAEGDCLQRLKGHWIIDQQATLANIKNSPKFTLSDEPMAPQVVERVAQRMSIELTPAEIIYYRGPDRNAPSRKVPFVLESEDAQKVVLATQAQGQEAYLTLTAIGDHQMNFRSSQTDDLDFYIWQKSDAEGTKE